jgi:predicted ATPase
MARGRPTKLPAPYLRALRLRDPEAKRPATYPFNLPWLTDAFELRFDAPVTIIMGENGTGKSTLIEGIAALAGYDEAGGGKGYRPVDHSRAIDTSGADLAGALRASWLPKVTSGWFFKAESFFSVARYLDEAAQDAFAPPPDFLSHSHGEGFLRFFEERMHRQGIYFMDEPESALSPKRQVQLLQLLAKIQDAADAQVILATHSPILMAVPGAALWQISHRGIWPVELRETSHFRLYQSFALDPETFVEHALRDALDELP